MGFKRKQQNHETSANVRWKPMSIECSEGWTHEDFTGLVALEQLDNYQIVRENNLLMPKNSKIKAKTKSKKAKATKSSNEFDVEVLQTNETLNNESDQKASSVDEIKSDLWKDLSVPENITKCLHEAKMFEPTAIQSATIKVAIEERANIFGAAPTGSGKTLAFAIPLVTLISQEKLAVAENNSDSVQDPILKAIVLTPTRELAVQIKRHIDNICKYNSIKSALVVGGLAIQKQERILLKKKPDIIVATPGRLWEIVTGDAVPNLNQDFLSKIKYLVIDEADRMVEKSHFKELKFILNIFNDSNITEQCQQRQVFIFSATLTMNKDKKNKNPGSSSNELTELLKIDPNSLKFCDLTEGGTKSKPGSDQLTESIIHCMNDEKDLYLYYFVLKNIGRTIVFCNSIDCIRRLLNIFRFLQLNPLAIHSSMPQKRRLTNIERFTTLKNCLLFATDIAARGLDIVGIDHVIHYQVPRNVETYVHRSGRTARISNKGLSLILCDPKEEAFFVRDFSKIISKNTLDEYQVNMNVLKRLKERIKLAQQCDALEHKLRKDQSNENWFRSMAKACEILYDSNDDNQDDDDDDDVVGNRSHYNGDNDENSAIKERNDCKRKLKSHQKQLDSLLRKPIHVVTFPLKR